MTDLLKVKYLGNYPSLMLGGGDFSVNFLDCNISTARKDGVYEKHLHINYEMLIVKKGLYQCCVNETQLTLHEGDLLLIQPGQKHEDFFGTGCTVYGFHFDLTTAGDNIGPLLFTQGTLPEEQILHLKKHKEHLEFFQCLVKLLRKETKETQSFQVCNSLFKALFFKLLILFPGHKIHLSVEKNHDQHLEERIKRVFLKNLSGQPTLDELCAQCGMSRSSLYRFCIQRFNKPPRRAFVHYKILQTVEFMKKNPGLSIKEVSQEFGFSTPFHFSRIFKEEIGSCPSHYLKGKQKSAQ